MCGPCGSRGSGASCGSTDGAAHAAGRRSAARRQAQHPGGPGRWSAASSPAPTSPVHSTSMNGGAALASAIMRRSHTRRATSRLLENTTRGPIAPRSSTSVSAGARTSSCRRSMITCDAALAAHRDDRRRLGEVEHDCLGAVVVAERDVTDVDVVGDVHRRAAEHAAQFAVGGAVVEALRVAHTSRPARATVDRWWSSHKRTPAPARATAEIRK